MQLSAAFNWAKMETGGQVGKTLLTFTFFLQNHFPFYLNFLVAPLTESMQVVDFTSSGQQGEEMEQRARAKMAEAEIRWKCLLLFVFVSLLFVCLID